MAVDPIIETAVLRRDNRVEAPPVEIRLWPEDAPGAQGEETADRPHLDIYRPSPESANGSAVVVCPGGGYGHLALGHEGEDIGRWLVARGVTAFILHYRLGPRYRHPAPLQDAQRALRLVRARADEWNLETDKIGVWGFSAGGHLAASLATHHDEGEPTADEPIELTSCRPDFLILAYPVITFDGPSTHTGSRHNLLGDEPDSELVELLSNEKHVNAQTPPTFLFHTDEDPAVPAENSMSFYLALRAAGVPAELHIYEKGRHGVGLAPDDEILSEWPRQLENWMRGRDLVK